MLSGNFSSRLLAETRALDARETMTGEELRKLRVPAGLTQLQLAQALQPPVPADRIGLMERGRIRIPVPLAGRLRWTIVQLARR